MKWALLSVWDKSGIVDLARLLSRAGYSFISSGGTGTALKAEGIAYVDVASYTGFPEMMGGRVKTLHPRVHGGLLGRRGTDDAVMKEHGIVPIDLLVVNLYPFENMSAQALSLPELIEFIDVGGPAMIRAAAKNYKCVSVITDPVDYPAVASAIEKGGFSEEERFSLAVKAFSRTAAYDAAISNHLGSVGTPFPPALTLQFPNGRALRYGENPHQEAAVYGTGGIAGAVPLQGKQMSYNNYLDLNSAAALVREFEEPCAVIVKHNNPCGVASGANLLQAYVEAREADPVSAYGSVVVLNREVTRPLAEEVVKTFVEVLAAPSFTPEAQEILSRKENLRIIVLGSPVPGVEVRSIDGGLLVQRTPLNREHWKVVTDRDPTPAEWNALQLAWKVCAHTRSNAIVFANQFRTLGIGAGQMSRVDSAKIAMQKASGSLKGSAVGSDAFLPFPDTLEVAASAGATALVQPGGSIRDDEVIAVANRLGVAMVFTGTRHFKH
jgi:phosphoribosylaminoimidazolecarboxamide formyltransferase/IMP cyclohydrolase